MQSVLSAWCAGLLVTLWLAIFAAPVSANGWWAQLMRPADLWSGPDGNAHSFGQLPREQFVFVTGEQPFPGQARLLVQEASAQAYGFVEALALAPSGPPPAGTPVEAARSVVGAPLFRPFWVANHTQATLWSTPNEDDEALADLPAFSKLLVLAPVAGLRYYVQEARSERIGYVDSPLVGPSDPPTREELEPPPSITPAPTPAFKPWWVATHRATDLWSGMEGGKSFGRLAVGEHVLVMAPQDGARLHILNPATKNYAFVDAAAVGPSKGPKPAAIQVKGWRGIVSGDVVNLRVEPHTFMQQAGQVRAGDEVTVDAWVEGEELDQDNRTWARVTSVKRRTAAGEYVELLTEQLPGEQYIYSGLLRPVKVATPPPPPSTTLGAGGARWIDVNLTHQVVTAYEGTKAVYSAPVTSGRPGWETPVGTFRFLRRVENETMIGSTLLRLDTYEIPDYRLENVKWTQYFTGGGAALHTNYWRSPALFGMPSSHGCLGVEERHAKWFWDWATIGTPLLIHY